jgi:hypothetical protein
LGTAPEGDARASAAAAANDARIESFAAIECVTPAARRRISFLSRPVRGRHRDERRGCHPSVEGKQAAFTCGKGITLSA